MIAVVAFSSMDIGILWTFPAILQGVFFAESRIGG
jgi:hypothetical protein